MRPLAGAGKLLSIILLVLGAMLWAPLPCAAVVIHEIYSDAPGEGFKDTTPLSQNQRDMLSSRGNNAQTLGEARKNAFEHATSTLERRLTNSSTIRIEAEFVFFDGQEDQFNPGECGDLGNTVVIGFAGPRGYGFRGSRLDVEFDNSDPPVQINPPGLGTGYPYALFEALGHPNLNGQGADVRIQFTRCVDFYYGITEPPPGSNVVDFIQLAIHEIMHGIGFLSLIEGDGSYPTIPINLNGTRNGKIFNNVPAAIKLRTIFDEQLYSESDGDILVDASQLERSYAITSQTGLLWEGTNGGENACSYGVRMARDAHPSARASDGKPLLHAPAFFEEASSVSHVYSSAGDTMEATAPSPRKMELSLGMLRDLGWQVSGLPSECTPGGVTRNPTPPPPPPPPPPPDPAPKPDPKPETEPEPDPERETEREPEEKQPEPAAPEQSGGGGGCALASGEEKDHRHSYPLYLLLGAFYVFTALFVKNRSEAE